MANAVQAVRSEEMDLKKKKNNNEGVWSIDTHK